MTARALRPPVQAARPIRGGVLRLVGQGDVDRLDPALAYHTATRPLIRAYTRQLVTYRSSTDRAVVATVVPDLAEAAVRPHDPDGLRYRFTLKDGVRWETPSGARPVTADDVARGIKRLAHPLAPSPGLPYFLSSIAGLAEFREALASGPPDADAVGEALESTPMRGIRVLDDRTVEFETSGPLPDFLNILALPFATPAPAEYLAHVPGSPELEQAILSCGPYRIARYRPGRELVLERNPAWEAKTDDIRAAYIDGVVVEEGVPPEPSYAQVMSEQADMLWDIQPPTARLPQLFADDDPRLEIWPAGLLSPYLVINVLSPNNAGALARRDVRVALQYAVDKAAVAEIWGGPRLNDVADQILPPLSSAHREHRPYRTPGGTGDPHRARRLLDAAGHPGGFTLKLVYRNQDIHPATAEAIATALARAGIRTELVGVPTGELFSGYLANTASARDGRWDIALSGWEADWHGANGRVFVQALLDSSGAATSDEWGTNFGHYRSDPVNALIAEAMREVDPDRSNELFHRAEVEAMRDAAIVPILFAHQYWLHSAQVRNWLPYPVLNGDLTNLWLDRSVHGRGER